MNEETKKIIEWLLGRDTGLSSKRLCGALLGIDTGDRYDFPHDYSDFGRCERFLKLLSRARKVEALAAVAKYCGQWKALVENWERLENIQTKSEISDEIEKLTRFWNGEKIRIDIGK
jgi:hypothetical protein